MSAVHGPQRRVKTRLEFDPDAINRPRVFGEIDVWQGGSLVDFGFVIDTRTYLDPMFEISLQLEAAPGSLLDRLLCRLADIDRSL